MWSRMPEPVDRDRLFPKLNDAQISRIARRAERRPIRRNEVLWEVGAPRMDFYVILAGSIEIVEPLPGREESITVQGPREFTGDVDLIGADPNTAWLGGCVALDDKGFVKTGNDLSAQDLAKARWPLARSPYPLETMLPGLFAAGDVRAGSVKRIASAVGEAAACIQLVHKALQE